MLFEGGEGDVASTTATLTGKVALVTGASRGIGRAVAAHLGLDGARVAVGYRRGRAEAEELCRWLEARGCEAMPVAGDVADPAAVETMVDAVEGGLGSVDVLVSNAGSVRRLTLDEVTVEAWDRTLDEHLRAAFLLARRVAPGMQRRRWGRVVLMSSVAAFTGGLVGPHYTAAKAGLIGLMRSLAASLAGDGVTVNAVAPGLIDTEAVHRLDDELGGGVSQRIPVGRLGRPEEVADLVSAIVHNAFMTGQTVLLDGGLHPR